MESDNLISVKEISATEAARNFADVLDSVEHDGESYTIVRRGRPVAQIEPLARGNGAAVKDLLRRHRPDDQWAKDIAEVRALLYLEERR